MRTWMVLASLLAAAGGASAAGSGGWFSGGNGADLAPLAEGCLCYGYGLVYWVALDEGGNVHLHHDQGSNVGHYGPPSPAADLGSGRWLDAHGNIVEGRLDARTAGGHSLNAPLFQFLGVDAMLRVDPQGGVHAEAHDNAGGALPQHVGACVHAPPDPGAVATDVFTHVNDFAPFPNGVGPGDCRFET